MEDLSHENDRYDTRKSFAAVDSIALSMLFLSMCMGTAIGVGVVVSQYFGAGDQKNTSAAIANGSYACIAVAVIMTVIAIITTKPILQLLNTPASIMGDALYIYMGGLIAVAAYYTPFSMLRALGDSKTSLIFLVISSLLNIVLDLFFCDCSAYGCCGCSFCHSFVGSDCCCFVYHIFFPQSRTVQTGHSEPIGKYKYDPKVL